MCDRFQVPMANRAACVGGKPSQETREWWQRSSTMEEQSRMGGPSPFSSESFRGTGFGVQERLMKFYASARTERVTAEATSNCVSTTCWVEIIGSCMFLLYQSRINHSLYRSADSFTVHWGTTYDSASVITSRFDQDYLLVLFRSLPFVLPLLDCEASCLIRAHRTWHGQSRRPKPAHWDQRIFLNFSGGWYNDWSTCLQFVWSDTNERSGQNKLQVVGGGVRNLGKSCFALVIPVTATICSGLTVLQGGLAGWFMLGWNCCRYIITGFMCGMLCI